MDEQLLALLAYCQVEGAERVGGAGVEQAAQRGQRRRDPWMMDQAIVDRDRPPAARAVEPERRRRGLGPGDHMELAAEAIPPGVIDRVLAWRRMLDVLSAQGVEHDVPLQLHLVRIRNVLQLAAPALRHVGTRRRHPVW